MCVCVCVYIYIYISWTIITWLQGIILGLGFEPRASSMLNTCFTAGMLSFTPMCPVSFEGNERSGACLLEKQRQEDCFEFEACPDYLVSFSPVKGCTVRPCLQTNKQQQKPTLVYRLIACKVV